MIHPNALTSEQNAVDSLSERQAKAAKVLTYGMADRKLMMTTKRLGRAVGWLEAEVDDWLNQQIEASRKAGH